MNDNNAIIIMLVDLAEKKGFLTLYDIEEILPTEFNSEELDDLVSSIVEMGIQIRDNESHIKSKLEPLSLHNNQDFTSQSLLAHQSLEIDTSKNDKNILINKHIYLVDDLVHEYLKNKPLENKPIAIGHNDLVQEGYLGLLIAATEYKPDGGDNFPSFASKKITDFIEKAIKNEQRLGIFNSDVSREFFAKEHDEYITYWKDEEENIYTTKISDQSKSIDKDNSELTLTSISKIQLPQIPDFAKVKPSLASDDASILVKKKNIDYKTKFRTNRPEYKKSSIIDDISIDSENYSASTNESLPKVYSKVKFDNDRRLSLYAKVVGERAEKIVLKYLADTLMPNESASIRWISKSGETPGWDIEYYDSDTKMVAIEVKGTNGKTFPNVEITGNEWDAACELNDQYWIYLVSDCLGTDPKIQRLQNPYKLKERGSLKTTPILWRIEMISSDIV